MLLGTWDAFEYFECGACGCIQINSRPLKLGRYYPPTHFAYRTHHRLASSRWQVMSEASRYLQATGSPQLLGWIGNRLTKAPSYIEWVRRAGMDRDARILDVGCSTGKLVVRMKHAGFRECVGLNPYIPQTIRYANRAVVYKQELVEHTRIRHGGFELVMAHHVLEHMPSQHEMLQALASLVAPGGCLLIRIPVAGSYAWRHYREHWFRLDAPRHLYIHTVRSLNMAAARAGMRLDDLVFDSTAQQFLGSELYLRDIAMHERPSTRRHVEARRSEFEREAKWLNEIGEGDTAAFYFRPA